MRLKQHSVMQKFHLCIFLQCQVTLPGMSCDLLIWKEQLLMQLSAKHFQNTKSLPTSAIRNHCIFISIRRVHSSQLVTLLNWSGESHMSRGSYLISVKVAVCRSAEDKAFFCFLTCSTQMQRGQLGQPGGERWLLPVSACCRRDTCTQAWIKSLWGDTDQPRVIPQQITPPDKSHRTSQEEKCADSAHLQGSRAPLEVFKHR